MAGRPDLLDLQLSPLGQRAIEALAPSAAEVIVDSAAKPGKPYCNWLTGEIGGEVTGVDIAPLLLERARLRAAGRPQARVIEFHAS